MDNNELDNNKSMRSFLLKKYLYEFASLMLILGTVFGAAKYGIIDSCTAGTLFGAVIGFFAKGIRKIHK